MSEERHPMMTCDQLTGLVTDYMEHRLSLWEAIRFQFHLGLCGPCREYLAQMEKTRASLGRLEPAPMSDEVRAELKKRFRSWKAAGGSGRSSGGSPPPEPASE